MKKLLIVNDLVYGGGVERLLRDFVWKWHDQYDITVLVTSYQEDAEKAFPENVSFLCGTIKNRYENNIVEKIYTKIKDKSYNRYLREHIKKEKYDTVIAMKDGFVMKMVSEMDIPDKLAWHHTDYKSYYYTYDLFNGPENERKCMQKFRKIVCVSENIRDSIRAMIGDPGNLVVRYNPIPVDEILSKAKETVVDLEAVPEKGKTRFVTVGRLNYQKGYDLLMEACHMLERENYQFEVIIIGSEEPWGDEHNRIFRAQKRLGVKSVRFLGGRNNPYKYVKCADWFLSSSLFEGYSLVSQEAAVLDIPLLLTDCSGVRELLGDNEYGLIMENSVYGMYAGMKRVMDEPELHDWYRHKIKERKAIITYEKRFQAIEELLI